MTSTEILIEIEKLKDGERFIVPESDYGKAEIWLKHNTYFLFSIPIYGGEPQFESYFKGNRLMELIEEIDSWT